MAEQFTQLTQGLIKFIESQHIYFVGTARAQGRVNVSPKGADSLRVLSPDRVVWQNLTGSGNESAAHVLDHNRMTLMFCSFEKKPLILRLYGQAEVIYPRHADWDKYVAMFPVHPGTRQFFNLAVDMVQTSCGFAVPYMDFVSDRDTLDTWTEKKGEQGIRSYWEEHNQLSIDGFETAIFEP